MLFVTMINILPGNYKEAIKVFKHCKVPEGIKIRVFVGLFGQKDAMILFDAENEACASDFTLQFGEVAELSTALACPVEQLRWTH